MYLSISLDKVQSDWKVKIWFIELVLNHNILCLLHRVLHSIITKNQSIRLI